jgi:hypothetical protein
LLVAALATYFGRCKVIPVTVPLHGRCRSRAPDATAKAVIEYMEGQVRVDENRRRRGAFLLSPASSPRFGAARQNS